MKNRLVQPVVSASPAEADESLVAATTHYSTETGPWQEVVGPAEATLNDSAAAASHSDDMPAAETVAVDTLEIAVSRPSRSVTLSTAWTAELCLWFTAVAWGTNLLVVKLALGHLNPWVFNTSRLTLATIMLGVLAWMETRFRPTAPAKMLWVPFLLFALLNGFLYQIVFFLGISQTTAGNTALLLSSMPMWTAAFSFLFIRERLPLLTWGGLGVTFCGTLFVLLQNPTVDLSGSYLVGNLYIMAGAMTWASATVISRPLLQSMSPVRMAFLSSLITMPLHFAVCWPYLHDAWPQLTEPGNVAAIVYSGSISTGVAYATWHYGVRHLGGSRAGVYQNVVTLVAVIGGWMFLAEPILVAQFVGGLAIIAGVLLMRIKR